jgi:hypothetical protein
VFSSLTIGLQKKFAEITSDGVFEPFVQSFGTPPVADPSPFVEYTVAAFRTFYLSDSVGTTKFLYQVSAFVLARSLTLVSVDF